MNLKNLLKWFFFFTLITATMTLNTACSESGSESIVSADPNAVQAVSVPQEVDPLAGDDVSVADAYAIIDQSEDAMATEFSQVRVAPLTGEQLAALDLGTVAFDYGTLNGQDIQTTDVTGAAVLYPAVVVSADTLLPLYQSIAYLTKDGGIGMQVATDIQAVRLLHFMNHANEVGIPYKQVTAMLDLMWKSVQAGLESGAIYKLPASGSIPDRFVFFGKLLLPNGKERIVAAVINYNGAPITIFHKDADAGIRFANKLLRDGYVQITAGDLPADVVNNWRTSGPQLWRILWWAVSYHVEMTTRIATLQASSTALSTYQVVTLFLTGSLTDITGVFIIPDTDCAYCSEYLVLLPRKQ
ncbi:hypothetical protein KAZ57_00475 [Patescibacteria group bacterium]|nr:hypothetical protein [Patescibacteria group bacterium]